MATTMKPMQAAPIAPAPQRTALGQLEATPSRMGGALAIVGALLMAGGGVLYGTAGADLWGVVDGDVSVGDYIADAAANASTLHTSHTVWIIGVLTLCVGLLTLIGASTKDASRAGRAILTAAPAIAVPSFLAMAAVTRMAEAGGASDEVIDAVAFLGVRGDDIATILILGLGVPLIVLANRDTWIPGWLFGLGLLCGLAGAVSAVSIFFGQSDSYGFAVVPLGVIWTIGAGLVAIRASSANVAQKNPA